MFVFEGFRDRHKPVTGGFMQLCRNLKKLTRRLPSKLLFLSVVVAITFSAWGRPPSQQTAGSSPIKQLLFGKNSLREDERQRIDRADKRGGLSKKTGTAESVEQGWAGTGSASLSVVVQADQAYIYSVAILDSFGYEVYYGYPDSLLTVTGLHPGSYTVEVDASNGTWYLGNTPDIDQAQWIHLSENQSADGYSITVPDGGVGGDMLTISGILSTSGEPIENTSFKLVFVSTVDSTREISSWEYSDYLGNFSAEVELPAGQYFVMIQADGYVPQWWNGDPYTAAPQVVTINGDIEEKAFVLSPGASISGTILDGGFPLNGDIYVECIDEDGYIVASHYVNEDDSTYSIGGLLPGAYYLRTYSYGTYETLYYPGVEEADNATAITVLGGEEKSINLTVTSTVPSEDPELGTIRGLLEYGGESVPITASIDFAYEDSALSKYTWGWADEGSFNEEVFADKPFKFLVEPEGAYYIARTWYPGVLKKSDAGIVTVTAEETTSLTVSMQTGGSVAGFLTYKGGPVTVASTKGCEFYSMVVLRNVSQPETWAYGEVTERSAFRIVGLAPGTYDGYVMNVSYGNCGSVPGLVMAPEFTIEEGKTTRLADLALGAGSGSISGTGYFSDGFVMCVDEDHRMVAFAEVGIEANATELLGEFFQRISAFVQEEGAKDFKIHSLPAGNYYLLNYSFEDGTYEPEVRWYGSDSATSDFEDSFIIHPPSDATLITVGEGQQVTINMSSVQHGSGSALVGGGSALRVLPGAGTMRIAVSLQDRVSTDARLTVHDCRGRMVHQMKISEKSQTLSWPGPGASVPSGTYLFSLRNNGQIATVQANVVK